MSNSTITRCVLVTLLAFHFGSVCGTAQDASPVRDEAKPVETTQPPAATTAVDPLAASQMPDISGTWGVKVVDPKEMSSILGEMEIRRVQNGATDFLIDQPWVVRPTRVSVQWSDARQRFEGGWKEDENGEQSKITLQPLADKMKLRVIISSRTPTAKNSVDSDGSKENETKQLVTQEWTRTSSSLSTTFDKNNVAYRQLTAAVSTDDLDEAKTHADAPAKAVQTKVFTLANCSAVGCGKLLRVFYDDRGITWDTRTNSIVVVTADEERMKAIEAILLTLDEAPSTAAATKPDAIEKVREPTERLEVIHRHVKTLATREAISRIAIAGTDIIDFNQLSEKEIAVIGRGVGSTSLTLWFGKNPEPLTILVTVTREGSTARLETPAAKKLVEQLQAQESAAAVEAATIRQLHANGQAEQNRQPMAEHQRKLKNLLSTAFDLKLQLEELQVRELQSRLSRLERQIGQRKELREKIITRRAAELVEGGVLKWTPDASRINQDTSSKAGGETSSTLKATSPLKPDEIVIDLYGGSGVLPGLSKNSQYSQLVQRLNALKGVVTNIREAGQGSTISMAIVRDPSGRLLREIQPNEMASELHSFILLFLTRAGIQNVRWEGHLVADATSPNTGASDLLLVSPNAPKMVSQREATHQVTIDFPIANFPVIPGDRIEVQHVLHAEEGFHGLAKTIASGLEVVGVARSLSTPTRTALTLATTPEVATMLEQSATTGLLFCHPLDPVAMLPCGRAVRIPLGMRPEGRLTVGDAVQIDRMSLVIGESNLAEPKFAGFASGLLIGFEEGDIPEGTTEPKSIVKLLLPKDSNIDAHVFQNNVDELIKNGSLFRGKRSERGDATLFHAAVAEIEWQIESLEKRIAYYQAHVLDNAVSGKVQLNLGYQRIRLEQLKVQQTLYKTSSEVMARVRPLNSAVNDEPSPP